MQQLLQNQVHYILCKRYYCFDILARFLTIRKTREICNNYCCCCKLQSKSQYSFNKIVYIYIRQVLQKSNASK